MTIVLILSALLAVVAVVFFVRGLQVYRRAGGLGRMAAPTGDTIARLAAIVETSDDAIIGKDLDGVITAWNPAAARMFGYRAGEAIGRPITLILPPERQHEEDEVMDRLRRGKHTGPFETERRAKNGRPVEVSVAVSPIRSAGGVVVGAFTIARDISESRRSDEARRQSEATARALIDSAAEGILIVDDAGRILQANRSIETMFGYPQTELIGRPMEMLLPERLREAHVGHRAAYVAEPQVRAMGAGLDLPARRRDGREFPVEISLSYVSTPQGLRVMAFIMDVTQRRRADEALRQSEETARALIDSAAEGILIVDERGRIVQANGLVEGMFGYAQRELIGQAMEMLMPERFRDRHVSHRAGYVAEPRVRAMGTGLDLAALRRDGTEFPVEISLSYVRTPQGLRVMAFITDITQRLVLERSARQSEKLAALGTLSAGLAHELNNPLGIMISRIELMLLEAGTHQVSQDVRDDLGVLYRHAQRVSRLVQGLLSFARPTAPERGPVDLNHVVDEIVLLVEKQLSKTGIRLTTALDRSLPPVQGDSSALQQVVLNLVTNANQAMTATGGEVRIATRRAPDDPRWIELTVDDTGPGIPPDLVTKIFDPFFTTKPDGTGLGLSITYRIVTDHDGTVGVRSAPGEGTEFRIRLPVSA